MAKGATIGTLQTQHLVLLLGDTVEVRRSARADAKYPLYLSCRYGPIPLNHADAQELILEKADLHTPGDKPGEPKQNLGTPPESPPGNPPVPAGESAGEPGEKSREKPGWFDRDIF